MQGVLPGLGDADGAQLQVDGPAQVGNLCGGQSMGETAGLSGEARLCPGKSEGGTSLPWRPRLSGEAPPPFAWHVRPSNSVRTLPSPWKAPTHPPQHLPSTPLGHTLSWGPTRPLPVHFRSLSLPGSSVTYLGLPYLQDLASIILFQGAPPPHWGHFIVFAFPMLPVLICVCPFHQTENFQKSLCLLLCHVLLQSLEQLLRPCRGAPRPCKHHSGPQDSCLDHSFIQWNLSG